MIENKECMKVIAMNGFGMVDTFREEVRIRPEPKEKEVRIKIMAAGFNPVDYKIRSNWYGGDPKQILGCDCCGIVDAVGQGVERFVVGDEVCAMTLGGSNGSYAQYTCVAEELVVKKPKNISFNDAATIPLAAMTAYRATLAAPSVKAEDIVFVVGAGGGVGSFAIQLLKYAKVGNIYTIARDEESAKFLTENLEINRNCILIYKGRSLEELKNQLLKMNNGNFFNSTFDFVGGEMKRLCLELTGYSGHFSTTLPEKKFDFPFWEENAVPRSRNLSVLQVSIGAELGSPARKDIQIYQRHLEILMNLFTAGVIKPPMVTVVGSFGVDTVRKAHALLESGRVKGKLVMTM